RLVRRRGRRSPRPAPGLARCPCAWSVRRARGGRRRRRVVPPRRRAAAARPRRGAADRAPSRGIALPRRRADRARARQPARRPARLTRRPALAGRSDLDAPSLGSLLDVLGCAEHELFQRVARAIAQVAVPRQADARSPSGTRTTFDLLLARLPLALVPAADLL